MDYNLNNNNQPNKPKKKGFGYYFKNYGFIFVLLLAIALMLIYSNINVKTEELDINTVVNKIESGEIVSVYIQNGTEKAMLLMSDASEEDKEKFPSKYTYWVVINDKNVDLIYEAVNATDLDADGNLDCQIINATTPINYMSYVMPVLYVIILLISLFMIYKLISKAGAGKGGSFGKGKIKNSGEHSRIKFSDVAGIKEEKAELEEIVDFLKSPHKYISIGARIPKGVLLVGDPGTGKTLLAKAIAGESGVPFFSMSGSDFVEMFVGVGASRVRDLFEEAKKNAPCIIFIDEIDAVGRKRGMSGTGANDEREQTLNQLLVEMDGFEGNEGIIVIAATNRADILDNALTRPGRFDRKVVIYPPDIKGREDILRIYAKNKKVNADVDFKVLAKITAGFTGANLESLMNEAALRAAKNGKTEVSMIDITESVNKVLLGVQKKSRVVVEKDREITAYHESGHAILRMLLSNCADVQEVSIVPRGFAGGYTLTREEDKTHVTFSELNDYIAMAMGGRIAEVIQFGDYTTGASNDIVQATKTAKKMVTEWGMSELGFINLADTEDAFIGFGSRANASISEQTSAKIDAEVRKILDQNYKRAYDLLLSKKDVMDEMAKVLLDRETIYQEDVVRLINGEKADVLIAEIEKRETKRFKEDMTKAVLDQIDMLISDAVKVKNGIKLTKSAYSEEQFKRLVEETEKTYEKKCDTIREQIKKYDLDQDLYEKIPKFSDVDKSNVDEMKEKTMLLHELANKMAQENGEQNKDVVNEDDINEQNVDKYYEDALNKVQNSLDGQEDSKETKNDKDDESAKNNDDSDQTDKK